MNHHLHNPHTSVCTAQRLFDCVHADQVVKPGKSSCFTFKAKEVQQALLSNGESRLQVLDTNGTLRTLNIETGRVVNTWKTQRDGVALPQVWLLVGRAQAYPGCRVDVMQPCSGNQLPHALHVHVRASHSAALLCAPSCPRVVACCRLPSRPPTREPATAVIATCWCLWPRRVCRCGTSGRGLAVWQSTRAGTHT